MESFNDETQRRKVAAGFKGGTFFQDMALNPARSFVQGYPSEVAQKLQASASKPSGSTTDTWFGRRSK